MDKQFEIEIQKLLYSLQVSLFNNGNLSYVNVVCLGMRY